ncbi:glutamine--fructose-6-phosphate transaminase (isomerizing) [Aliarcobacter cryaerophilus]|jgi:glucosamine--fructose-6-phosphate aminotransferase (isomerizing)|uniref:Glutamine--fructose-6-phosphate aminotransferase [isomerizing] n=6 Tax=Arcobacteraceae TaxID=2808963 RepID=A0A2S9TN83_9BACT|nr:glutamine--fructose-6-phosphate transaminase (isomerizing) [Aliarcobacter cryaerophilus]OQA74471.1 MAG: Glutamine--fructose-6-phosphate aminotransferase (isomerizing) [Candidatus Dependentiae bacterium ADurb.Bin246]WNL11957.1 glutamine--fructose-6-phosphate transaminase (isomerizing) [Arcobacter sp. AZ-2023]WPD03347.1 glutamine--fructose-6-phosphate transaminase (isomerizing) [Arcobacter sp. DSM 115972]WPD05441.1 glutamine--fructose-6-phosphate transaminase (isomerizing) [Arcobacter sp. DSM 
MCGIVGYIGKYDTTKILLDGLKELEYRGYDSAGIAVLHGNEIDVFKAVGKLVNLEEKVNQNNKDRYNLGIGHTRWATHGKPTEVNAHPHLGEYSYVVHNGIIENYKELKDELTSLGHNFVSQTDTEVIVHLFEHYNNKLNDAKKAFQETIKRLEGAYAILLITKKDPEKIFFYKLGSPMIVGHGIEKDEVLFASSDSALIGLANDVVYLDDKIGGVASRDGIEFFSKNIVWSKLPTSKQFAQKDGFRYFMEKEIYEQSVVVSDCMLGRVKDSEINFDEIDSKILDGINEIKICACGTSYHAGLASSYLFERLSKIKCSVEVASEFRYKEPLLTKDTLFVVISQSGETADTLEALKMAKNAGLKTLVICNVDNSSMTRVADFTILTRAGIEKGVASTKAFSTQTVVLWMLSLYFAQIKETISKEKLENEVNTLREVPKALKVHENIHEKTKRLSKRYLHGHGFFFIGRDVFYPLALEGALKLKEISYLHAEGYPAGEMKHGPIALADPELFTIALMPKNMLYDKIKSNVEELSARDSTICAISSADFELADDFIKINKCDHYMLEFFEMLVALQILSMEISIRLKNDVDMPRNLAKSVTVE